MGQCICVLLYFLLLRAVTAPYLAMMRSGWRMRGAAFQFSAREALAALLGLAATPLFTAGVVNASHNLAESVFVFVFFLMSQLSGVVIAVATGLSPSRRERAKLRQSAGAQRESLRGDEAGYILCGALIGIFMPVIGLVLLLDRLSTQRKDALRATETERNRTDRLRRFRRSLKVLKARKDRGAGTTAGRR
jgi:small-conductance mechanosensitive channel